MSRFSRILGVTLALATVAPIARAQTAAVGPAERFVEASRIDRLEASIAELAAADMLIRRFGSIGGFVLGGGLIAGGVLVAVEDEGWGTRGRAAVSGAAWAAGASLVAIALYRILTHSPGEERLARWSALRHGGKLDVFEFARFEGELAAEAQLARFNRSLSAVGSFGLLAAGGGLIALGASDELGDDGSDAYILGSVLAGVGAIQAVALFWQKTPAERAWKHYQEGGGGFFSRLSLETPELVAPARF
jgi:hypothetical protein